jgi:hypothetical protein
LLLANQAEGDDKKTAAQHVLARIKTGYPQKFKKLLYGSVHSGEWQTA